MQNIEDRPVLIDEVIECSRELFDVNKRGGSRSEILAAIEDMMTKLKQRNVQIGMWGSFGSDAALADQSRDTARGVVIK